MRLFLAFPIPSDQSRALAKLRRARQGWRWIDEDSFHLTLAFLGEVGRAEAEDLDAALSAMTIVPPEITLSGIGHFGSRAPRAVWVGAGPSQPLADLAERVTGAARRSGIPVERRKFVPHVTLARLNATASAEDVARFAESVGDLRLPPFTPRAVTLFRSHLRPEGPLYEPLADYPDGWP